MGEFEKDIRDMFADFELQIETNEIWPGIEKRLNIKKDKRRFLWWWLTPMLLALPLGTYLMLKNIEPESNSEIGITTNSDKHNINDGNVNSNNNSDLEKNKISEELISSKIHKNTKPIYTDINKNKSGQKLNRTFKSDNTLKNHLSTYAQLNESVENNDSKLKPDQISTKNNTTISSDDLFIPLEKLMTRILYLYNKNNFVLKNRTADPVKNQIKKVKNQWSSDFDIAVGFALANKFLHSKDESFEEYRSKRENTENQLEAINSSLSYQLKNKSGFFVGTGLNYTQIDENFSDNDSIDFLKSGDGIISIKTNPDGTSIENRGKKELIEHRIWNKNIYNYYFFFDIPVYVGYSGKYKKLQYEFSSGVSYNLLFLKAGQIIGLNGYPVDIAQENDLFKTSGGISLISGLKLFIPYKKYTFFVEPNLRFNLNSVSEKSYPLTQRYLNYGIKVGGRINL
jgi:hypothetical protein